MKELTYDEAHRLFRYDPDTGKLYWLVSRGGGAKAEDAAGYVRRHGRTQYRHVETNGKLYGVHRVIWLMHCGSWPEHGIDHIDGDGLNNRVDNLRDVPQASNVRNSRMRSDNTSGVNGVSLHNPSGKWRARSSNGSGTQKYLGLFDNIRDAERAVREFQAPRGFTDRHGKEERGRASAGD